MTWTPTEHDLEWTKKLFNSLKKDGGQWVLSATGRFGQEIAEKTLEVPNKPITTATFTRKYDTIELTDIHIQDFADKKAIVWNVEKAKVCFEASGIKCNLKDTVASAFAKMQK